MPTLTHVEETLSRKTDDLLALIQELVRLEGLTQQTMKLPAEQLLDGLHPGLAKLEREKSRTMRMVDRCSLELFELGARLSQAEPSGSWEAAQARVAQALRSLQRLHQDSERILQLRLHLLSEDLRQVERSRQFLRATLQAVSL